MRIRIGIFRFLAWNSTFWRWSSSLAVIALGGASLVGAIFCVHKAALQGPPHLYLPLDDAWQEAWQQHVLAGKTPSAPVSVAVQVSGAVEKPGVYQLSGESRLQDAILQAGGFQVKADQSFIHQQINLASKLSDQQKVYIPFQGESASSVPGKEVSLSKEQGGSKTLNTATKSDFQTVSGIGEVRAAAIVAGQPYTSREDFKERSTLNENLAEDVLLTFSL